MTGYGKDLGFVRQAVFVMGFNDFAHLARAEKVEARINRNVVFEISREKRKAFRRFLNVFETPD